MFSCVIFFESFGEKMNPSGVTFFQWLTIAGEGIR